MGTIELILLFLFSPIWVGIVLAIIIVLIFYVLVLFGFITSIISEIFKATIGKFFKKKKTKETV